MAKIQKRRSISFNDKVHEEITLLAMGEGKSTSHFVEDALRKAGYTSIPESRHMTLDDVNAMMVGKRRQKVIAEAEAFRAGPQPRKPDDSAT